MFHHYQLIINNIEFANRQIATNSLESFETLSNPTVRTSNLEV